MAYVIIRILVNALALALMLSIVPGIQVDPIGQEPLGLTYLLLGLGLGIINAFIRPFAIILTARLLIWSMGLFAIVLNAVLFSLLALLPGLLVVRPPQLLWIVIASLLVAIAVLVMEAIFGLDSPLADENLQMRPYWRFLGRLPLGRRNAIVENLRVSQISDMIARYTKDIAVDLTPLAGVRGFMQDLLYPHDKLVGDEPLPVKGRLLLQELGPTFVKFGQMVGSRRQTLPPEWLEELSKLQSNVRAFDAAEARKIIIEELGKPPEQLYATFEPEPFAAASTAQVHKATLHDGTLVVVKVQRPNIDITVKADLNVMRDLADTVQRSREWARNLDVSGLVNEFADNIILELDYTNEATNAKLLAYNMREFDRIHVPEVYTDLSARRVMTQEFVKGVKITNVEKIEAAGWDRIELARQFLRAMVKQVLFDGFFHADPHPGNLMVDLETGQIIFLDMGLMGDLSDDKRLALGDLIWSLKERDPVEIAKTIMRLSTRFKNVDEKEFISAMDRMMKRYLVLPNSGSIGAMMNDVLGIMRQYGLRMDSALTLALKALIQSEEVVRGLAPNLPMVNTAYEQTVQLLREQFDAEAVVAAVRRQVVRSAKEVVRRIPSLSEATVKWLDEFQRGRFTVYVDTSDLTKQIDKVDDSLSRNVNRLVFALILAGLLVGSAIATTLTVEYEGIRLADVAFLIFLGSAIIGSLVVIRELLLSGRR